MFMSRNWQENVTNRKFASKRLSEEKTDPRRKVESSSLLPINLAENSVSSVFTTSLVMDVGIPTETERSLLPGMSSEVATTASFRSTQKF